MEHERGQDDREREIDDQRDNNDRNQQIQQVACRQQDRGAGHVAVELGKGDDRTRKGDRADRNTETHFDQALGTDHAGAHVPRVEHANPVGGG